MISFIVIGKNESWRLTKCFKSINSVIQKDHISDSEIIYVDSKSHDNSIERAFSFKDIRVFQITGECNAAIARNIGAKEARGEILFFIDGDMEILSGFLTQIMDINGKLCYPFISGIYEDYEYDSQWNFIEVKRRYKLTEGKPDSYEATTGGLFLIEKILWELVGGMDTRLVRSQDLDLGLKLRKQGIPLLRKPILAALHHTQSYLENKNINNFISYVIYTAILARKNLFNRYYLVLFMRTQYSAIIMFLMAILVVFKSPFFFFGYLFVLMVRSYKVFIKSRKSYIYAASITLRRDSFFLFAFFFKYPTKKEIKYMQLTA